MGNLPRRHPSDALLVDINCYTVNGVRGAQLRVYQLMMRRLMMRRKKNGCHPIVINENRLPSDCTVLNPLPF